MSIDTFLELKLTESNEFWGFIIVQLSADDHINTASVDPHYIDCDLQLSHQCSNVDTNQLMRLLALEAGPSIPVSARAHHSRLSNVAVVVKLQRTVFHHHGLIGRGTQIVEAICI